MKRSLIMNRILSAAVLFQFTAASFGHFSARAQEPALPPAPPAPEPAAPARPAARPRDAAGQPVTMYKATFKNSKLDFVLKEYSELTGRTALVAPGVALPTGISLESQTELTKEEYMQAIESILAMYNISIIPYGDKFMKVVQTATANKFGIQPILASSKDRLPETDQIVSKVVDLSHMELNEANAIITSLLSPYGQTKPIERINALLITDLSINVNRVLEMLEHIDKPFVNQEKLFVRQILNSKPSDIAAKLTAILAELEEKKSSTPTVARPRPSGPPGTIRAMPVTAPTIVPPLPETVLPEGETGGLVRGRVKIIPDDRTGKLIFITLPANTNFFNEIVDALDVETDPDVMVKVYQLEFANAGDIATMINALVGNKSDKVATPAVPAPEGAAKAISLEEFVRAKPAEAAELKTKLGELRAENIKILPDKRTNSLIVMGSKSDLSTITELIQNMDMMLSQVLIEAVIVEVNLTDTMQTGVDWLQHSLIAYEKNASGGKTAVLAFTGKGGGGTLAPAPGAGSPTFPEGGGLTYYLTHFGLNADVVVRAVSSDNRSRIVSAPVILTTDNTDAEITSTERIYVYAGTRYDNLGQNPIVDYKTEDIGLKLKVKPHINKNKVVMMEIEQNMSQPEPDSTPASGSVISRTRTLNANIAVKHGETIILGGQVRHSSGKDRTKIPLLGDIPLLGRLFNYTSDTGGRTEMIVFITPYVLDTPEAVEAESKRRHDSLDVSGMWKKGWSDSKLAESTKEEKRAEEKEREQAALAAKKAEASKPKPAAVQPPAVEAPKVEQPMPAQPEPAAAEPEVEPPPAAQPEAALPKVKPAAKKADPVLDEHQRNEQRWRDALNKVDEAAALETM